MRWDRLDDLQGPISSSILWLYPFWHTLTTAEVLALGLSIYALYRQLRQELPSWISAFFPVLISHYHTWGHHQLKLIPISTHILLSLTLFVVMHLSHLCIVYTFISILQMLSLYIDLSRMKLNLFRNSIISLAPKKNDIASICAMKLPKREKLTAKRISRNWEETLNKQIYKIKQQFLHKL